MIYTNKFFQLFIIVILFIHLVIGTPFTISEADEVVESSQAIETIIPTENTVLSEPITETFPVTEVIVTDESTVITYTEDSTITSESDIITNEEWTSPNTITYTEESLWTDTDTNIITWSITETWYLDGVETTLSENEAITGNIIPNNEILPENIFSWVSENNILLSEQPELVQYQPQKEFIITNGLIDPLSIDSYNVIDKNSDMTFCSYVSYLNLKHITSWPEESFARWDAINIWTSLTFKSTIAATGEVIFTGTNLSGQQFIEYLSGVYTTSGDTLFDIVTLKPKKPDDFTIGLSLHQSHRFILFLGTDFQRYVLDPIRTDSSDPILLTSYLTDHIFEYEDIKIITSYALTDTIQEIKEKNLTTWDIENSIIVNSPMEFLPYVLQGLITSTESWSAITNEVIFHTGFRYETVDGSLSAFIPSWLVIKTADEEDFNPFTFHINELSWNINQELSWYYNDNFQFGISGQHLIFSQPIQITVQTPEYIDGVQLDLLVQHEGQDWNKQWLTNNFNAQCLGDGSVSQENQGQTTQVASWKVIFYTCGASSFALWYVPAIDLPNSITRTIAEQSDGKILIWGDFTTIWGIVRNRIARLNTDKSLDTSFNLDPNGSIYAIAVEPDGQILVWWAYTTIWGIARNRISRFNSDGTIDTSFNPDANFTVSTIALQSDGNIIIWGDFTTVWGTARNRIARVSSTWLLDTSFNPSVSWTVNTIVLQTNEQILIGGVFTGVWGTARNRIARVSSTWLLDTSFNPNANNIVNSIALQSDGQVLLGGTFTTVWGSARNRIARVSSTWLLDTSFNPNANNSITSMKILNTNRIIVWGLFTTIGWVSQTYLAYLDNWIINTLYNARPNSTVNIIKTQINGQILLGGAFTTVWGTARNRIARITSTGSLDTSFNPNANNTVSAIAIQPDGKILLGGAFTTVWGTARNRIARVSSTWLLDTSFNPSVSWTVSTIAIQSDGQILLGGAFTGVWGTARNNIARVSSTWLLDTSFNPNANNTVSAIAIQPDGQILLGGVFTTVWGTARNRIARISSTGSLDNSFNPNANNTVTSLVIQPDGKILIGGVFTSLSSTSRTFIGRISNTGLLDNSFNPVLANTVYALYYSSNWEIFAWGNFTSAWWVPRTQLAKILSNGSIDYNLDVLFSAGKQINTINMDNENNLLVWGSFTSTDWNANAPYFSWIGTNNYVDFTQSVFWADAWVGTNCSINNCAISKWTEKAFWRSGTQTTGANQPVYISTGMNFNPTIKFAGTPTASGNASFDYINYGKQSLNITNKMSIFVVQNLSVVWEHYSIWLQQSGATQRSYSNVKFNSNKWANTTTTGPTASSYISTLSIDDTISTHHINGSRINNNTITAGNILSGNNLWVWGTTNTGTFSTSGDIAEIIVYNKILTWVLRNQIESYLWLKYSIILNQSLDGDGDTITGTSYRNGIGDIIWDSAINTGYTNNIIWLGRDSSTSLDQRISKSSSTGDIITITTTEDFVSANQNNGRTSLDNNNYIIMWHNGAITWFTASYNSGINNRMSRIWRVESTNMSTGIYIGVLSGLWGIDSSYGIVASADTLFDDNDIIANFTLSGGYLYSNITIPDWYYFTFAKTVEGEICIEWPDTFTLWTYTTQNTGQIVSIQSDYFKVDDQKWSNGGYYTTLSISNLTWTSWWNIISSASSVQIRATTIDTLSGTANASVILDTSINSYISANTPVTFIRRDIGAGIGIQWTYGSKIDFRIIIPAYQRADTYTWIITYTLYEN